MKKIIVGSGVASALAALAAIAAIASPAGAQGPDGCYASAAPGSYSNCIWYADVTGEYGGAVSGGWWVYQVKYSVASTACPSPDIYVPDSATSSTGTCYIPVASGGPGPFTSAPGTTPLAVGNYYDLVVQGGAAAEGSITGTGTI